MRKGVKVSKEQNNEGKRQRSTQQELCVKYNKERSKLYRERKKLKVSIESGNLNGKKLNKSMNRLMAVNYKVDGYTSKLFKCGKRYAKLKSKKRKLVSRISYLKKVIENPELKDKERKQKFKELMLSVSQLNDLNYVMSLKLKGFKDGKLEVAPEAPSQLFSVDNYGFWELKNVISDIMSLDAYTTLYIDGIKFDVKTQSFEYQQLAAKIVSDINQARFDGKNVGTPRIIVESDLGTRIVRIITND
jgi:hypothetical protein